MPTPFTIHISEEVRNVRAVCGVERHRERSHDGEVVEETIFRDVRRRAVRVGHVLAQEEAQVSGRISSVVVPHVCHVPWCDPIYSEVVQSNVADVWPERTHA